jgi:plastocyanin
MRDLSGAIVSITAGSIVAGSRHVSEGTFHHRFDEPGTYDYVCTLHPNMTGTIEVTR